jgi:hypothetical protein
MTPRLSWQVIAPALIPRKPGERTKTNPLHARKLVELLRGGPAHRGAPADAGGRDIPRS